MLKWRAVFVIPTTSFAHFRLVNGSLCRFAHSVLRERRDVMVLLVWICGIHGDAGTTMYTRSSLCAGAMLVFMVNIMYIVDKCTELKMFGGVYGIAVVPSQITFMADSVVSPAPPNMENRITSIYDGTQHRKILAL